MAHEDKTNEDKWSEHKKQQMMWPVVIILAALVFAFWAYNLKNVWQSNSDSNLDLGIVKEEISNSLGELEQKLEENSRLKDDANEMLNELIEEAKNSASSSDEILLPVTPDATTTPGLPEDITIPRNINCPEWINCMPTIGEPRSCQIPAGCEGITQIAY